MSEMLTQAEIDALLNGATSASPDEGISKGDGLSPQEADALGEIGNISMGTSATTLFTLLGQKVLITTPKVEVTSWDEITRNYAYGYVAVKIKYTHGMTGANLLILKSDDVKIITDIMMGGEGKNAEAELSDIHLSAISEAMNQMIGSAATSMSSMFNKRIDISPPNAFVMDSEKSHASGDFNESEKLVRISFKMVVGDLIDSEIMQIIPIDFAKSMVNNLLSADTGSAATEQPHQKEAPHMEPQQNMSAEEQSRSYSNSQQYNPVPPKSKVPVNVQPAQFESFDESYISVDKKNIGLIMDVPLQVTVELGRTNKLIREILELGTGSVIELDKLAGEPVDILVNGKAIAKGEVVVIDESFGVRVTDIMHPSKRL